MRASFSDVNQDGVLDLTAQGILSEVLQIDHYYPFGMRLGGLSYSAGTENRYRYNGKELHRELGLGWYDYGARMYDPSIGRWNGVDNKAHWYYEHSPFIYAGNDPIAQYDPNGEFIGTVVGTIVGGIVGGIREKRNGGSFWKGAAKGAVTGAIAGAVFDVTVATAGTGTVALVAAGALSGAAGSATDQMLTTGQVNGGIVAKDAMIGGALGPIAPGLGRWIGNGVRRVFGRGALSIGRLTGGATEEAAEEALDLGARAREIHSKLSPHTQRRITTAVGEVQNPNGTTEYIVGSSERRLRPAQRAALRPNETEAVGTGHAEATVIESAASKGQKVSRVGASRPICDDCANKIQKAGATPASPLKNPRE